MVLRSHHILLITAWLCSFSLTAQKDTRAYLFTGLVQDENHAPVPNTHVIAEGTGDGDVTDHMGIFQVFVRQHDLLSFYNIALRDTTVVIEKDSPGFSIILKRKFHPLREAKIFEWGSTYEEFLSEAVSMDPGEDLQKKLDLPERPDDYVPFDMDEERIRSVGFLINSPVSFLYYNLSRKAKSERRAYELQKNSEKIDLFNELVSPENIGYITGLKGEALKSFMLYMNSHISVTFSNTELEILTEIHALWDQYKQGGFPEAE